MEPDDQKNSDTANGPNPSNVEPDILSITWFHLSGYVNSQNSMYWWKENPDITDKPSAFHQGWCLVHNIHEEV